MIHEGEKLTSASFSISVWFSRLQQDSVCFLSEHGKALSLRGFI